MGARPYINVLENQMATIELLYDQLGEWYE